MISRRERSARRWPRRFGAFATVPMHEVDDALAEIAHCCFAGVCLFASYGGKFLGDARFDPLALFPQLARR